MVKKFFQKIFFYTVLLLVYSFFFFPHLAFASTTPFRSAKIVTTAGSIPYTNLGNCSITDGDTCDRTAGSGSGHLRFRDFGNYDDFGMPVGSKITYVKMRVTGKASPGIFAPLVTITSAINPQSSCQWSDSAIWILWDLNGNTIKTQTFVAKVTEEFEFTGISASCLEPSDFENNNNFMWQIVYSQNYIWSASIDNFEIAFDYDPAPTPTPTPILTPIPFLDLPWDYEGQGKSFEDVGLNPVSWFDHQYPLQNVACCIQDIITYTGKRKTLFYKSHNGYDYGLQNGVELKTPVLAAASGIATFKSKDHSSGAGNVIKIDHGNGYQTWYEHLGNDNLIVSTEETPVPVLKGQKIGEVGMTGNTNGPHIHFSVFKDSNIDGSFDDEIPFGVVDPLGWEGAYTDPWIEWSDGDRTGTKSFNLFIQRKAPKSIPILPSGSTFLMDMVQIRVPNGALNVDFTLIYNTGPFESISDILKSIVPSFFLNAVDSLSQKVTQFLKPIEITYNYANADLFNINEDTLKLYSFNEQTNQWEALVSNLDKDNKTISGETTHFSQFAVMGEVKDNTPPTTSILIHGAKGEGHWYRSALSVELNGKDNDEGIGLQYTLYTMNGNDWFEYKSPLVFENEGTYSITYQSFDKAENIEERKTLGFNIDKTPPELEVHFDTDILDLVLSGKDNMESPVTTKIDLGNNMQQTTVKDKAGNMLVVVANNIQHGKEAKMNFLSLQYNSDPLVSLDPNSFLAKYNLDHSTADLRKLEQEYDVKQELKLKLLYTALTNKTQITTTISGQQKQIGEMDGIRVLQLNTEKGTLKYSY